MFKSISVKNFLHTLYAEIQSLLGMRRSNKKYNKKNHMATQMGRTKIVIRKYS